MAPKKDDGTGSNMGVDYVIVYRFADTDQPSAVSQFDKLCKTLASVGLATQVRNGEKCSVLVFTKLYSEDFLHAEVYRSRTQDWLHGIRSSAPDKETKSALEREPLYPAERLRIIYQLITNPVDEGGAGITAGHGEWKNVESIFALHDHEFNREWMKRFASSSMLKIEDLDIVRDRFGEKVAYYFAFTQGYFTALLGIAAFGTAAWLLLGSFSPTYAIVNSLLCIGFIEYWKYQQEDLAIRWGVRGVSLIDAKRHDFEPEKEITDPVTGAKTEFFPATTRFQRQLLVIPFALSAASILGALIATCFGIEIFVAEIYNGPLKSVLVFLPTGILTTCQPLILGALTQLAERLTKFENYDTHAAFEKAMIQKIFVLNFITSYMPIFLTAFVYVPFATVIVPYLDIFSLTVKPFAEHSSQMKPPEAGFAINPDRLKKQVIYFTVTAQIVNQALEVVLPYVKRQGFSKYKKYQSERAAKKGGAAPDVGAEDHQEEAAFLERVRREAELDDYDVTTDFREMVMQYGYLSLFSVVWPLTAVSFVINNWIELRTDALKICVESQHPKTFRADGIGPWLDSLGFLTWLGSITTAAIVYMFSNGGLGPGGSPEDIKGWALLLAIFTSEHSYMLVRHGMQLFVSKLDSPGRQKERAERYAVRRQYLEESIGAQTARVSAPESDLSGVSRTSLEEEARQTSLKSSVPEDRFWLRQRGWQETAQIGKSFIARAAAPVEDKKKA